MVVGGTVVLVVEVVLVVDVVLVVEVVLVVDVVVVTGAGGRSRITSGVGGTSPSIPATTWTIGST